MGEINARGFIEAIDSNRTSAAASAIKRLVSGKPVADVVPAAMMVAADALIDGFLASTQPKSLVGFSTAIWVSVMEGAILERGGIDPNDPDAMDRAMRALGYKK